MLEIFCTGSPPPKKEKKTKQNKTKQETNTPISGDLRYIKPNVDILIAYHVL